MWGSHFPYEDANWPDDRQQAMRVTDEVAADDSRRCWPTTWRRLYRLRVTRRASPTPKSSRFEQLVHF